jgi:hypothetical protein
VSGPVDGRALTADPELLPVHPDDDGDQGLQRTQILIVLTAKAQRIAQPIEAESGFGGQRGQMILLCPL